MSLVAGVAQRRNARKALWNSSLVHPVPVIGETLIVLVRRLLDNRAHAPALHVIGDRQARIIEKGRREIDIGRDVGRLGVAGTDALRIGGSGKASGAILVHEALVEPAVLAKEEPLVGRIDDDGVVRRPSASR